MADTIACPACAGELPKGSRFCPHCGVALAPGATVDLFIRRPSARTRELLARQRDRSGISLYDAHRRPLGASPPALLGTITVVALVAMVILMVSGAWIGALIALGLFLGALSLLVSAVRHDHVSAAARVARRNATRVTDAARYGAVSAGTWVRAAGSLVHLKQRRVRLRRELRRHMAPLGEAVHQGDELRAEQIKAQTQEIEHRLEQSSRQAAAVIAGARQVVEHEKATVEATQPLPIDRPVA